MRTNKEQQQEIIFRYQNGESSEELAQEYCISGPAVRGLLARHGIERRGRELAARKYTCNHDFFCSIDSEEKAYWLGFIAADGCIYRNEMKVSLSLKDKDHLLRLAKAINSSHPITTQTKYSCATFTIYSTELTNDLIKHGITPQKTFTLQWPTLSSELLRHFTRGYVDGDGCFTLNNVSSG